LEKGSSGVRGRSKVQLDLMEVSSGVWAVGRGSFNGDVDARP
jgi:hypothetical protein